ncbi:MAG: carboxymuconolactone decarboxylase family protein [Deltaproteobacteria bacterium]|nr:carboxymuconolactone decarboxylase family protein [Deltaproteobacteria bacterium]
MSDSSEIPAAFKEFGARFPELARAHESVARAVDAAGPLDGRTRALIKIGMCLGAGLESALKSHVRRALAAGASEAEIEQAIVLGMNACGFPRTVAAWSWARQQFKSAAG